MNHHLPRFMFSVQSRLKWAFFGAVGLIISTPPILTAAEVPVQQAYLKAANADSRDRFGTAVAVEGDLTVVGSPGEASKSNEVNGDPSDNSQFNMGAAYVFGRDAAGWTQQAYLKASDGGQLDEFGRAVAVSGTTVVIGAPFKSLNGTGISSGTGAAYVFIRENGQWSEQAILLASNAGRSDEFGASVAISGDTLVIGAPGEDSNATGPAGNANDDSIPQAGAAYVFVRQGSVWSQQAYLKAANNRRGPFGAGGAFGRSVAVQGDTVVVGADVENSNAVGINGNGANNNEPGSGAAYVFERSNGEWAQRAFVKPSTNAFVGQFGFTVGLSGGTMAIGAIGAFSDTETRGGLVYVFSRAENSWTEQAILKASNAGSGDRFGTSIGLSGDRIVVGAVGESANGTGINGSGDNDDATRSGAAHLFARTDGSWSQVAYVKAGVVDARDEFGIAVAISGDTAIVGAPGESSGSREIDGNVDDNGAANAGAGYVFGPSGPPPLAPISFVAFTDAGFRFSLSVAPAQVAGVEYSELGPTGPWVDLGDLTVVDATGTYIESDPTRSERSTGYYRVVLR